MMITDQGQIVRTPASGIPVYSRTASGVIVMRLPEGQQIVNFTKVAKAEEETEEATETAVAEADQENKTEQ
jgi:DNA gyrase/topoisomerase IV subunit A